MGLQIYLLPVAFYSSVFALVLTIRYFHRKIHVYRLNPTLPPLVPGGLPYLGNVFGFDRKKPHMVLTDLSKKHGGIFRLKLLGQDIVVVSDATLIREALTSQQFAGRPYLFRVHYGFHYKEDVIFATYSERWLAMKKTAMIAVKEYGTGTKIVNNIIDSELDAMVKEIHRHAGAAFDPSQLMLTCVVNAICAAVLGKRYNYNDPQMAEYKLITRLFSESCSTVQGLELDLFPMLRFFPNETFKKLTQARGLLDKFVNRELEEIKQKNNNVYDDPKCIVESLMKMVRETEAKIEPDATDVMEDDVRSLFIDILVSGTLTSSIALTCFILYMLRHPNVQIKARLEVINVIGESRHPEPSDREHMPYLQAIIMEILRFISHVPMNLPHYTLQDTKLGEYDILEKTQVLMNLWSMHHDDKLWDDPWTFNPERFLDLNGELVPTDHTSRKNLLPFGLGRRMCIGESLAKERIFLFAATLLQNFTFGADTEGEDGFGLPSCDPRDFQLGLILEPKPFNVKAFSNEKKRVLDAE